jgi:hypothetical protein
MLAAIPMISAKAAIIKNPTSLLSTVVKIKRPKPKTMRFDAKVKKFRKLLRRS